MEQEEAPLAITGSGGIKLNFGAMFGRKYQDDKEQGNAGNDPEA